MPSPLLDLPTELLYAIIEQLDLYNPPSTSKINNFGALKDLHNLCQANRHLSDILLEKFYSSAASYVINNQETPTLLHWAAKTGNETIAKKLLQHGADPNLQLPIPPCRRKCEEQTSPVPLALAVYYGHRGIVVSLLDDAADVNRSSWTACTPLHLAAMQGNLDFVQLLLSRGAHVDSRRKFRFAYEVGDGRTPLFYAAEGGHVEIVEELMNAGASACVTDSEGVSVLEIMERAKDIITEANCKRIRELLDEGGSCKKEASVQKSSDYDRVLEQMLISRFITSATW